MLCEKSDKVYMKQALFRQSVRLIIKQRKLKIVMLKTSKNYRKSQQETNKIETKTEIKPTKNGGKAEQCLKTKQKAVTKRCSYLIAF